MAVTLFRVTTHLTILCFEARRLNIWDSITILFPLQWRHNEPYGVSITTISTVCSTVCFLHVKENIKAPCHCHCEGNPPVTDGFPSTRAINVENVSILWRHHGQDVLVLILGAAISVALILIAIVHIRMLSFWISEPGVFVFIST